MTTRIRMRVQLLAVEHFRWELFGHPPYSPDIFLSDFHLFTHLKNWLRSQRFNINEVLVEDVKTWLISLAADFLDARIQKLISRCDRCLISGSNYIEN
jgi:hypothetical protein